MLLVSYEIVVLKIVGVTTHPKLVAAWPRNAVPAGGKIKLPIVEFCPAMPLCTDKQKTKKCGGGRRRRRRMGGVSGKGLPKSSGECSATHVVVVSWNPMAAA